MSPFDQPPSSQRVQLTPDEFTWVGLDRVGVDATSGPNDMLLIPNSSMTLRYTPISTAMLAEVDEIGLHIDRRASRGIRVALELWNWETETWDLPGRYSHGRLRHQQPGTLLRAIEHGRYSRFPGR